MQAGQAGTEGEGSEGRGRRPSRRGLGGQRAPRRAAQGSSQAARVLLALVALGSLLAVGAVHLPPLVIFSVTAFAAAALSARLAPPAVLRKLVSARSPAFVLAALGLFCLVQALPIPAGLLEKIAPANADTWARALLPFGEAGPRFASISLDPGASCVEALKWTAYAAAFFAAAAIGARRGASFGAAVVFASALAAALTTVAHGLAGATKVFGLYTPKFGVLPWHVGPLLNPNNLAGYLNLGVLAGLGLLLARRPLVPPWAIGLGIATIVGVEITAASRGGVLGLAVGLAVFGIGRVLQGRRRDGRRGADEPSVEELEAGVEQADAELRERREGREGRGRRQAQVSPRTLAAMAGLTLAGGLAFAVLASTQSSVRELFSEDLEKVSVLSWVRPLVAEHPIFGIGRGAFETVFPAYRLNSLHRLFTHAENFLAQWASEWGLPVTILALAALAWQLRPASLGARKSSVALGALAATAALLAQNLFDLGLEVPALCFALAILLGSAWGAARGASREAKDDAGSPAREARFALVRLAPAAGLAGLTLALTLVFGRRDVESDRLAVQTRFKAVAERLSAPDGEASREAELEGLRAELRAAMLRHPAESYFSLVGASAAARFGGSEPMPWVQRALERGLMNSRTHLVLAEILMARGARGQAFLELRLAGEYDKQLWSVSARLASRWARSYEELAQAIPEGEAGVPMLAALGEALSKPEQRGWRARVDAELLARSPNRLEPRMRAIEDLTAAITKDACPDAHACLASLESHLTVVEDVRPGSTHPASIRARVLRARSEPEEVSELLAAACEARGSAGTVAEAAACRRDWMGALAESAESTPSRKIVGLLDGYVSEECAEPPRCAAAALWVGNLLAKRRAHREALKFYARAARAAPDEAIWLRIAETASHLGAVATSTAARRAAALERAAASNAGAASGTELDAARLVVLEGLERR